MISRYTQGGVVWIDFESPTMEELLPVAEEFQLNALLIEELLSPTTKPRADVYHECVYLVLHFPSLRHTRGTENNQEIDIILGKHFIITTHYTTGSALYDLGKAFETASLLPQKKGVTVNAGFVFLELIQRLYQSTEHELDALEDTITGIEAKIFKGHEREMVTTISHASRELLTHKRLVASHHEILKTLEKAVVTLFGDDMARYVRGASALHYRVHSRITTLNDVLDELRETNMALLSTRQNEIMKNLTVMAFIAYPLTFIASLFNMTTVHTPIVGMPNDFYIILGGMVCLTVLLFLYFKLKNWF